MSESIFYGFFLYRTVQKKKSNMAAVNSVTSTILAAVTSRENPL